VYVRGYVALIKGVCVGCFLVTDTAQVELRSKRARRGYVALVEGVFRVCRVFSCDRYGSS